jgi:hypothetical protein
MFNNFLNEFLRICDLSFPVIVVKRNKNRPLTPWMTKALLESTRKKNKLYTNNSWQKEIPHENLGIRNTKISLPT